MPTTLTWDAADLDSGTDDGVVHENTTNTDYSDASEIRKGDPTAAPIAASDLYLWYPLQESSGSTANDFSGNGRDASYVGASVGGGTKLTGLRTPQLDGVDDYIDVGDRTPPASITQTCVFYPTGNTDSGFNAIFGLGAENNTGGAALVHDEVDNSIRYDINTQDGNNFIEQPRDWVLDEWNFMSHSYDASTSEWRGYYASESVGFSEVFSVSTGDTSGIGDTSRPWLIGSAGFSPGGNVIEGSFSDTRLYSTGLSQSTVRQIWDVFAASSSHTAVVKTS